MADSLRDEKKCKIRFLFTETVGGKSHVSSSPIRNRARGWTARVLPGVGVGAMNDGRAERLSRPIRHLESVRTEVRHVRKKCTIS